MKNTGLWSSYIYTNINEVRQNSYLKLISIINNLQTTASIVKKSDSINDDASQLMLTFNIRGKQIAFNDKNNTSFFFFIFPVLFIW